MSRMSEAPDMTECPDCKKIKVKCTVNENGVGHYWVDLFTHKCLTPLCEYIEEQWEDAPDDDSHINEHSICPMCKRKVDLKQ